MKTIALSVFLTLSVHIGAGQTGSWSPQNAPVSDNFTSISVIDEQHAWVAGGSGTLLYTEDGGTTWVLHASYPQVHFESIFFTGMAHGCLVGWSGEVLDSTIVLITNDAGQSWTPVQHPQANYFYDVFFINENRGWAVGIGGVVGWIIFTDDGGYTWNRQMTTLGISGELYAVHFRDTVIGHICGVGGTFLHTNNAGTIGNGWAINISIPTLGKDLYGMLNYDAMTGWAVGEDGSIIATLDNWTNWFEVPSATDKNLNAIDGDLSDYKFWAVGNEGTIIHKAGTLSIWGTQASGVEENLNDVGFANSNTGWAVGNNSTILKYSTGGSGMDEAKRPPDLIIYPNPTSGVSGFGFRVPGPGQVTLKLYDMHGREVAKISDEWMPAGEHMVSFDVSGLPAGVYFVRMQSGSEVAVRKLVVSD